MHDTRVVWAFAAHPRACVAIALLSLGCGGRIAAIDGDGDGGAAVDATVGDGDLDASADALNDGRGPAPLPVCSGISQCLEDDAGVWRGGALIKCDPAPFVGPWNILLERQVNGIFQISQRQSVQAPGFGATFQDILGRSSLLTYRVCVVDDTGTNCAKPFRLDPTPGCVCEPTTCDYALACDTTLFDGCGAYVQCGACTNGVACNHTTSSCCPPGFMADLGQTCVCAPPPSGCPGRQFWDTVQCACDIFQF